MTKKQESIIVKRFLTLSNKNLVPVGAQETVVVVNMLIILKIVNYKLLTFINNISYYFSHNK